ncbi:MAG: ApbE family protein [Candidatus Marinimicrobia bacterium]|jgi:hypothetical protein|nr:ApbE family protein [Candidatus Neomarinimicrobiota bacterium]MBT3501845.1 ApbE family protein [Candidatus Neomarinimicrobiota bacterium]MBT3838629.1 ApbE family protein [Candidatus Neomarinimicrobiota bacterium]MBT3999757.1 ApbE family protein [Candidatus Neomarinimicrobiota bacterium]MBT4578626.1 ApbE family protein [Candidatus Neomarinimicrobiota bacterium]
MNIVLGIIILLIAIAGMAIGIIFNRKPLTGSCGGANSDGNCPTCGGDTVKCKNTDIETIKI